jgi:hypothetical protein
MSCDKENNDINISILNFDSGVINYTIINNSDNDISYYIIFDIKGSCASVKTECNIIKSKSEQQYLFNTYCEINDVSGIIKLCK